MTGKDMKHLWDCDHSYECYDGNYFSNDCCVKYGSFGEFLSSEGDSDFDMNLLFRFDWKEGSDHGLSDYTGDDYYRHAKLHLYWVGQRKGLFRVTIIDVCRADELNIIGFLRPRMEHLFWLWEPLK